MTEEMPRDFDGFITPDGELVSIEDVDGMLSILCRGTENRDEIVRALWGLAVECSESGHNNAAHGYCEKILALVDTPGAKAECILAMGQALERSGAHKAALDAYSRAFEMPQEPGIVWYFLHNNLGCCLNLEGRYREAEMHCRDAIKINPDRYNAHKNLGISLQGQGRYSGAAKSLMFAVMACPEDARALGHLEHLIATRREILHQEPDLMEQLRKCHELADSIRGRPSIH